MYSARVSGGKSKIPIVISTYITNSRSFRVQEKKSETRQIVVLFWFQKGTHEAEDSPACESWNITARITGPKKNV